MNVAKVSHICNKHDNHSNKSYKYTSFSISITLISYPCALSRVVQIDKKPLWFFCCSLGVFSTREMHKRDEMICRSKRPSNYKQGNHNKNTLFPYKLKGWWAKCHECSKGVFIPNNNFLLLMFARASLAILQIYLTQFVPMNFPLFPFVLFFFRV